MCPSPKGLTGKINALQSRAASSGTLSRFHRFLYDSEQEKWPKRERVNTQRVCVFFAPFSGQCTRINFRLGQSNKSVRGSSQAHIFLCGMYTLRHKFDWHGRLLFTLMKNFSFFLTEFCILCCTKLKLKYLTDLHRNGCAIRLCVLYIFLLIGAINQTRYKVTLHLCFILFSIRNKGAAQCDTVNKKFDFNLV